MLKKNRRRNMPESDREPKTKPSKNPLGVMAEFCDNYHIQEAKDMLWEWLVTAVAKSPSLYDHGKERSNLFFFYENIEDLIEAIYVLNAQRTPGKTPPTKAAPPNE